MLLGLLRFAHGRALKMLCDSSVHFSGRTALRGFHVSGIQFDTDRSGD